MSRHRFDSETLGPEGYVAKHATRQTTLRLIQKSEYWVPDDKGGYLNGDWIELCGEGDDTLRMLLDAGALRPGVSRYIGVNLDQNIVDTNKAHYSAAVESRVAEWRVGGWADVIADFDSLSRVRVVVFDGFNALHNSKIDRICRDSMDLAEYLYRRNGVVLLVMNFSLRGPSSKMVSEQERKLRAWKESLCHGNQTPPQSRIYRSKVIPMLPVWLPLGF